MYSLSQISGLGRSSLALAHVCRPIRAASNRMKWRTLCHVTPSKSRNILSYWNKCFCSSSFNKLDVGKTQPPDITEVIAPQESITNEELMIREADTVDSLLALYKNSNLVQKIASILNRLCDFHSPPTSSVAIELLAANEIYKSLLDALDEQVLTMPPQTLLHCVKSLMILHMEDTDVLKSLLTQLLWLMRKMTIGQLFHVQETFDTAETSLRKQVRDTACENLMSRWLEIDEPKHLVTLLYRLETSDSQHVSNLETRVLDLCPIMTVKELYRVLFYLAKQRHRNTPLIRAAVYHLNKQDLTLGLQHLANLGYACVSLSVFHNELLVKWADNVVKELADPQHPIDRNCVESLTRTVGMLRLHHRNILDKLATLLIDSENIGLLELSTLLMTCAAVDNVPSSIDKTLETISQDLSLDKPKVFLDTLWSLAVLQKLQAFTHYINILFTDEFLSKLKGVISSDTSQLKLMNIHAAATLDIPSYQVPDLPKDFIDANRVKAPITSKRPVLDKIAAALALVAPGVKYMRRDVLHTSGHVLDFELNINSKGDFVPLRESDQSSSNHQPVAMKLLNFSDFTLGEIHPVGRLRMLDHQLSRAGYKVVNIPYHEYPDTATAVKQIEYLKSKLKNSES